MRRRPIEDWELPDPDNYDSDETDTVRCPACGAEVYEDAEQCPACGDYITPTAGPLFAGRTLWIAVAVILAVILTLMSLVPGF